MTWHGSRPRFYREQAQRPKQQDVMRILQFFFYQVDFLRMSSRTSAQKFGTVVFTFSFALIKLCSWASVHSMVFPAGSLSFSVCFNVDAVFCCLVFEVLLVLGWSPCHQSMTGVTSRAFLRL